MLHKGLALSQPDTQRLPNGVKSSVVNEILMCTLSRLAASSIHNSYTLTVSQAKPKNKMHADPEKLSHHVHRIGHHFPLSIIELACSKFGYEYDADKGLRKTHASDRENWIAQQVESYSTRQALHGRPAAEKGSKDHISGAVREMFPKIPEADLSSIVNHAFEEVNSIPLCSKLHMSLRRTGHQSSR
jgi:hypothetical protein